jgi:hypothetical protein
MRAMERGNPRRALRTTRLKLMAASIDHDGGRMRRSVNHVTAWQCVLLSACLTIPAASCANELDSEPAASSSEALSATIDQRRSLAVTDQVILARFSLKRVLDQLVAQSNVSGLTSHRLFQQWWDTQNPKPGLGLGPHCDDQSDPSGPTLNGFPYTCRPAPSEGAQAGCDPFAPNSPCAYIPIGLFNRFDLMPENGEYCGEYRIVYSKASGVATSDDRNLLIFEAALPNPLPLLGIEGCRPAIELWAGLSSVSDPEVRAARLEGFYFSGLLVAVPPFPPVIKIEHFGASASGRGQIRTNQFVVPPAPATRIWSLREFKLQRSCGLLNCSALRVVPVTSKGNPYGPLLSAGSSHSKKAEFQSFLPQQVSTLNGATIPELGIAIPDAYNSGQSEANGTTEGNFAAQLGVESSPLRGAIQASLTAAGSSLTVDNVVARAQAQTCAGCHRISNNADLGAGLIWPASLGFTHVTERETEVVSGQARYLISDALKGVFLPHRQQLLEQYLDRTLVVRLLTPLRPIGGLLVH